MIDHISIRVTSIRRACAFYTRILTPLGLECTVQDGSDSAGYGIAGQDPFLWLTLHDAPPGHVHFAVAARNRAAVEDFHLAALAAGGRERSTPGLQTDRGRPYFSASVLDPDRHEIEAICRVADSGF
jgi:catechol 2,3-dioxygenase-like lactoylglutathione lyase family enzyme